MIIATTTVGTEKDAKLIAKRCFADGFAACVQISRIESIYRWRGEPKDDIEYRLMFKTTKQQLIPLEKKVREYHRYELPEWIWWEANASKEYRDWVSNPSK